MNESLRGQLKQVVDDYARGIVNRDEYVAERARLFDQIVGESSVNSSNESINNSGFTLWFLLLGVVASIGMMVISAIYS